MRPDGGAAQARSRRLESRARTMEVARPWRAARNRSFPRRFCRGVRRARSVHPRGDAAPPARVVAHARAACFDLDAAVWSRLDGDERFALAKMGDAETASHNLPAALKEFAVPAIAPADQPRAK